MNPLLKRMVTVAASAVLATAATVAPATAASVVPATALDANYTCTSGTRFLLSGLLGYAIFASGCTGSGSGTYGTITIPSGSYFCQNVTHNPTVGFVNGQRC